MKKKYIFIIIGLVVVASCVGFYIYKMNHKSNNSNPNNFPYSSTRVSTVNEISNQDNSNSSTDSQENTSSENSIENEQSSNNTENTGENNNNNNENNNNSVQENSPQKQPEETEIASFSTKIYTKESDRQNNISITCSSLNNTIVESGKTFSFCNTVGKATSSKGYKKADVFKDGEKVEALGGR